MALTRRRLEQLRAEPLHRVELESGKSRLPFAAWLTERGAVPGWPGVALVAAWVAFLPLAYVLEPAPARAAAVPAWVVLLELAFTTALVAAAVGLAGRQRLGLVASVAGAGVALVAAVTCPLSGHHAAVGPWWYAQTAGFLALGGVSLAGLRASRSPA